MIFFLFFSRDVYFSFCVIISFVCFFPCRFSLRASLGLFPPPLFCFNHFQSCSGFSSINLPQCQPGLCSLRISVIRPFHLYPPTCLIPAFRSSIFHSIDILYMCTCMSEIYAFDSIVSTMQPQLKSRVDLNKIYKSYSSHAPLEKSHRYDVFLMKLFLR